MAIQLKPLRDQVMLITGASSGIGLATAEAAAREGTRLVLASRSEQTLNDLCERFKRDGGDAIAVACDVGEKSDVDHLAEQAIAHFGRIDTWVNDAGIAIYGRLHESSDEDNRRLFDTNFWGVVYGSLAALPHLMKNGGALINIGSEVSEASVPLLGMYVASKHAVKGFTDALRIEIEQLDQAPVSITLIQPTATNTPFPQHAKNYMDVEPKLPSPIIEPQKVAEAILSAAVKPTRAIKVGMMAKVNTAASKLIPGMAEKMAAKQAKNLRSDEPPRNRDGALHLPSESGEAGHIYGSGPGSDA